MDFGWSHEHGIPGRVLRRTIHFRLPILVVGIFIGCSLGATRRRCPPCRGPGGPVPWGGGGLMLHVWPQKPATAGGKGKMQCRLHEGFFVPLAWVGTCTIYVCIFIHKQQSRKTNKKLSPFGWFRSSSVWWRGRTSRTTWNSGRRTSSSPRS